MADTGPPREHLSTGYKASFGLVVMLGALTAFAALTIDMYLPGLPEIVRDLHAPAAGGALTVAAFYIGMCMGQLFHGPISDRMGRRRPLLAGIALYVLTTLGAAFAPSIESLIFLRFLQGLGGCAGLVLSRAFVRDRFEPQESAHLFSLLLLILSLSPILAPLIGSTILLFASWRAIFLVLAVFGTVTGIAVFFALPETRSAATAEQARGENPFQSYWAVLRERDVVGYALATGFAHAGLLTYLATTPDVVVTMFGKSPQVFGWVIAVNGIGLILANYVNRRLLGRYGYDFILRRANICSLICSGVLLANSITGFGGLWGILIPLFFIVGAIGFTQPNGLAGAMARDPKRAGSTSAVVGSLQFGLGAVGASIAGALHDGTARPMAAVIFTVYALAWAALRLSAPAAARRI
ncbi:MAG: multidrug effflux MFS transporter [Sphingomonadales bacterium]